MLTIFLCILNAFYYSYQMENQEQNNAVSTINYLYDESKVVLPMNSVTSTSKAWHMVANALHNFKKNMKKNSIDEPFNTMKEYYPQIVTEMSVKCNDFVQKNWDLLLNRLQFRHQTQEQLMKLCYFAKSSVFVKGIYEQLKAGRTPDFDEIVAKFEEFFVGKVKKYKFNSHLNYDKLGEEMHNAVSEMTIPEVQISFAPMAKEIALALLLSALKAYQSEITQSDEEERGIFEKFEKFDAINKIAQKCFFEGYQEKYQKLCKFGLTSAFLREIYEKIFKELKHCTIEMKGLDINGIVDQMANEFDNNCSEIGWNFENFSKIMNGAVAEMDLNLELCDDNSTDKNYKTLYNLIVSVDCNADKIDLNKFAIAAAELINANAGDARETKMIKEKTILKKLKNLLFFKKKYFFENY